jgi:hypothetical protein
MADLKSARVMYVKAGLLVAVGLLAGAAVLIEAPSWKIAALMVVAVWAFCRAYYFLFYVIERWIDPKFRFAGLGPALMYVVKHSRGRPKR